MSNKNLNKIKFTGFVVTFNEEKHLKECLDSLSLCEQLIVIDLGSSDDSIKIAKQYDAEIIYHKKKPIVEIIRQKNIIYSRNDWIIFLDPDEVLSKNIEDHLKEIIIKNPKVGSIGMPWNFYFKNKPLNFTFWGINQSKYMVYNKKRNKFSRYIHGRGIKLLKGYTNLTIHRNEKIYIKHYWIDSYKQLFEKHLRYIKLEGESRYAIGERFSWPKLFKTTFKNLGLNLFIYEGIKGGFLGIFLSIFYTWYIDMALLSLRKYQKNKS